MATNDWAIVAEVTPIVTLGIIGGWSNPLIEVQAPLVPGIVGGWSNPLAEMSALVTPSEVIIEGWKQVASMTATLSTPTMECSINADCPEGYVCMNGMCVRKEAGVPWIVPTVGAAAAVSIIIYASEKKKEERTKK